jgi:antirestriction protein ArdC
MDKQRKDIAQEITDAIVTALEAGTSPWQRPWKELGTAGRGQAMPHNAKTGKSYRGANVPFLMIQQQGRGYMSAGWLTFKQAKELGGSVRKGEKGTGVVFWKFSKFEDKDNDTGETTTKRVPFMRHYTVFNVDQCEDLPEYVTNPTGEQPEPIPDLAQWVRDTLSCGLQHGGDRAFYAPGPDMIRLPQRSQFKTEEGYNGTLLHEATHCTGSKSRLDRLTGAPFGSPEYAKEELVAEIGASMLCATLGLDYQVDHHASYVQSWLKALKGDKKFIFSAASKAQKALDFILERAGIVDGRDDLAEAA